MGVSLDGHLGQLGWRGIEAFSERESSQERGREREWGAVQSGISPSGSALYSSPPPVFGFYSYFSRTFSEKRISHAWSTK